MELNSNRIKSLLTNTKNLNLVITKPKKYYGEYKKSDIYNPEINEPLHKVWIKTPYAKTLSSSSFKNDLAKDLSIGFSPITKDVRIFMTKIKKIESFIASKLNMDYKPSVKKLNSYMAVMNLKLQSNNNRFSFNCYDPDNKKLDFSNVNKGEKISGYIELSDVWVRDDEIGFNWSILQCKVYRVFDFTQCLFDDEGDVPNEEIILSQPPPPPPMPNFMSNTNNNYTPPPTNLFNNNCNNTQLTQKPIKKFMPSSQDLLSAISKLKSVKNNNENENENNININNEIEIINPDEFNIKLTEAELDCIEFDEDEDEQDKIYSKIKEEINF